MSSLLLALVLHSTPAQLLVWGGGKTREAAEASAADWKKRSPEWAVWVSLQPDYPRIVESSTIEGLNPGFHIVVLGACNDEDVTQRLDVLKTLEPSVYLKGVIWPDALACPRLGPASQPLSAGALARVRTAGGELTAVPLFSDVEHEPTVLLVRWQLKGAEAQISTINMGDCSLEMLEARKDSLVTKGTCVTGRCTSDGHSEFRFTFTVKDGKVVRTDKELRVIDRMVCD